MPLFTKTSHHQLISSETAWDGREDARNGKQRSRSNSRPPPRGILRHSFVGDPDKQSEPPAQRTAPEDAGRQRFLSLPVQSTPQSADPSSSPRRAEHASPSVSQLSQRARLHAFSRTSDAEADRLARACGEGPFSPSFPSPYLSTDAFTNTPAPSARQRSQSASVGHLQRRRSSVRPAVRDFPHPATEHAIRELKCLLKEETKTFKMHDYIEVEDILSGRLWEDEDELPIDCVRDKVDEDNGHDGVWRRERKERKMMEDVQRKMRQRDQNVFGTYIQDLPESAMIPVIVGGYRYHVPIVLQASIDELYRTGIYEHCLFRTLPNRTRLFQLVAHFDVPPISELSCRGPLPNIAVNMTTDSLPSASQTPRSSISAVPRPVSLRTESYPELCALLVTYLTSLPTPLIHRSLSKALWAWCVLPSMLRHKQRPGRRSDDASSSPSSSSEDDEETSYSTRVRRREEALLNLPPLRVRIKIARSVLLLLPKRTFGTLVYVLSFFDAVVKAPDVGMEADDIGRLVGGAVVGSQQRRGSVADGKRPREAREDRAQAVVAWLLRHWSDIASEYECGDQEGRGRGGSAVGLGKARAVSMCVPAQQRLQREEVRPHVDKEQWEERKRRTSSSEREDESVKSVQELQTPKEDPDPRPDDIPRIELPLSLSQEKLFNTPSPFDLHTPDDDDDISIYSNDNTSIYDMYDSSLLQEPLPELDSTTSSKIPRMSAMNPSRDCKREFGADAEAASRFLLEKDNLELKRRLAEALGERDEARKVVIAMRGLVGKPAV